MNSNSSQGVQGITEGDIANYLINTPGFFERHADLLSAVQLSSPHGTRAVSLPERQIAMLRERAKVLEARITEFKRYGAENAALDERLHAFIRAVLVIADARELPAAMVAALQHEFQIPQAAVRLWGMGADHAEAPYAAAASEDIQRFAHSLTLPYCGANAGFEAVEWLDDPAAVASMAMIPLRRDEACFGMLVLGSPDAARYAPDMGTDFLMRLGDVASAALSRLL